MNAQADKLKAEKEKAEMTKILSSVVKSNRMVLHRPCEGIRGRILFPKMEEMSRKSIYEVKKLRVSKIAGFWDHLVTFSITLNDGQTC